MASAAFWQAPAPPSIPPLLLLLAIMPLLLLAIMPLLLLLAMVPVLLEVAPVPPAPPVPVVPLSPHAGARAAAAVARKIQGSVCFHIIFITFPVQSLSGGSVQSTILIAALFRERICARGAQGALLASICPTYP